MSDVVGCTNTTIAHCDKCDDPELKCESCPENHMMSDNKEACISQFTCYLWIWSVISPIPLK